MSRVRTRQEEYSTQQALMLDESSRRQKASKMVAVICHFLGRDDLRGLRVLDVGCSGGIVAAELRANGAAVVGIDIDRPGVTTAAATFGDEVDFVLADSEDLPLTDGSFDVVVCNHIYEHVVDPDRLFAELRRVTRPGGALYLGLANRYWVMEPHYRLPFLSWLPPAVADRYVHASGRASHYHERLRSRRRLRQMCRGFTVWEYTFTVIAEPARFNADDVVPAVVGKVPPRILRLAQTLLPTYIWVATVTDSHPAGAHTAVTPARVRTS
jgi:2-polyprenyl-3-methyl-5-hydroxy-6-metoxy-1,4-benzoquinol methylase